MNRTKLAALALVAFVAPRAALASGPEAVVITNTAQNPGVISVAGTANIAGSVSISNTPNINVANSPAVQQNGNWSVDLIPNAQVTAHLTPDASVQVSSLPLVSLAPNQTIAVSQLPALSIAPNQSVLVTSLPSVSVSSMPSVNVSSLPSVNVGTMPSVNVGSMPSVNVASMPAVTIANQPGAGARYAQSVGVSEASGGFTDPVPTGKRLILTHVSSYVAVILGHGLQMIFYLPWSIGNSGGPTIFPSVSPAGAYNGQAYFTTNQQLDVIIEAGEQVACTPIDSTGNNVGVSGACHFMGRLIDAQ